MKPVLMLTNANFLGHLVRCIAVGKSLRQAGTPVVFAASGRYVDMLHQQHFPVLPIFTPDRDRTLAAILANQFNFYDLPLARTCVEAETMCIRKLEPAAIVGDFRWTAKISAERCRTPYISIINILWTPYGSALRRRPSPATMVNRVRRLLHRVLRRGGREGPSPFAALRAELGLKPPTTPGGDLCGDLNLIPDLPELFPPAADMPGTFHYIGPLFGIDHAFPSWLSEPLPNPPYLYCALSSAATPHVIELAIAAFGDGDLPVVISTGRQRLSMPLPPNVRCYDFLPDNALQGAAAIVSYGGNGTIYQALAYGTPIIGIATHQEQVWQLAGVEDKKLGRSFEEKSCTVADLRSALDAIQGDPDYRRNCAYFKELIASSRAPELAATLINGFARQKEEER